jgi:quercetin dioxygenase-like cupin family protein
MKRGLRWIGMFLPSLLLLPTLHAPAQGVAVPGDTCKPANTRTQAIGCWILADNPIGQLTTPNVFWHLDTYPTRTAAEADKGPRGTVVESFGKIWLMTIADERWKSAHGTRVAEIGPLPVLAGEKYTAQFMEADFTPGMTAPAHVHSGPEAWYAVGGKTCLETSDGHTQVGQVGGPPVIVPMGLSMHLTAIGTEQRRSIVLILHQSSQPPTTMVHDWTPKGLCAAIK